MITFAVFSDLHMEENNSKQQKILNNIVHHFQKKKKENWIDFILIAGDLTAHGEANEFDAVLNFLEKLKLNTGLPNERFFLTPGNHDYNRNDIDVAFKYIKKPSLDIYKEIFSSSDFQEHINRAFFNYNSFLKKFYNKVPNLYGYNRKLEINDLSANISVVNSCLANTIGNDTNMPFIHMDILNPVFPEKKNFDLSLLLMHHPLRYLYLDNRLEVNEKIQESFDLIFNGHEHFPSYHQEGSLSSISFFNFTSGCVYLNEDHNPERYHSRFFILEYDPSEAKGLCSNFVTNPRINDCANDTLASRESREDGKINFSIEYRKSKEEFAPNTDPLGKYVPSEEILRVFNNRSSTIFNLSNKKEIINFRKKINTFSQLSVNDIVLSFLKYLISEQIIMKYEILSDVLKEAPIFKIISKYHNPIKVYYNEDYFSEVNISITEELSRKIKKKNIDTIIDKNIKLEDELLGYKRERHSFVEMYKDKSIKLFPHITYEFSEDLKEYNDWYEHIGLRSNPFPSKVGLTNIDDDFYEKIVFKTDIIKEFQKRVLNNFASLENLSICISGPFGSGKTTLFQYLEKLIKINHSESFVIYISLDVREKFENIRRNFFKKLRRKLKSIHQYSFDFVPKNTDTEELCFDMLENLSTKYDNFLIIIEDIYKHSSKGEYIEQVIDFIKSLQIYRKEFSDIINTSFLFSAIDVVVKRLKGDHSTSGSIDETHFMSSINIDEACAMINQRLRAFCDNTEKLPIITRNYMQLLVNMEKHSGRPIRTFRSYIEIMERRFRRLEFTKDGVTLKDNNTVLITILNDLKSSHNTIYLMFQAIKDFVADNSENFEIFIKILENMYFTDSLDEESAEFAEVRSYFPYLYRFGLIKRVDSTRRIKWEIINECRDYFDKIRNIYLVNPTNILPYVFFSDIMPDTVENEVVTTLDNILKAGEDYGAKFLQNLNEGINLYSELYEFSKSIKITRNDILTNPSFVDKMNRSLESLLIALVIQCDANIDDFSSALEHHENSWYEIESVTLFVNNQKLLLKNDNSSLEEIINHLSMYFTSVKEISSRLKRFVQQDSWFSLKGQALWMSDKKSLSRIRQNIDSGHFELARSKLIYLIKSRSISFVYIYSIVLFGVSKWKRALPPDLNQKYINLIELVRNPKKDSINIPKFEEKSILGRFSLEDIFLIINHLNSKFNSKLKYLSKINSLNKKVSKSLLSTSKESNPWNIEILNLLISLDNFCARLLTGNVECPWNSHILINFEDISNYSFETDKEIIQDLHGKTLTFDNDLEVLNNNNYLVNLDELVYLITKIFESVEIRINYRKEEIELDINSN